MSRKPAAIQNRGNSYARLKYAISQYLPSVVTIWLFMAIFYYSPYYQGFLDHRTLLTLFWLSVFYTSVAPAYYLAAYSFHRPNSRGYLLWSALKSLYKQSRGYIKGFRGNAGLPKLKLKTEQRVSLLFLGVKIFFLPLMLNFVFANFDTLSATTSSDTSLSLLSADGFNTVVFPVCLSLLFLIDTSIFAFGYVVESKFLRNRVKSVEPTLFGWAVALMSYGIFFDVTSRLLGRLPTEYPLFHSVRWTVVSRIIVLLLLLVYVAATIALGFKASNLTNRGIVGYGPYHFVRHPAYVSKNLAWWIALIPLLTVGSFLGMLGWSLIYFFRALTEERHLGRDPAYRAYCRKVRYRFIPGVI